MLAAALLLAATQPDIEANHVLVVLNKASGTSQGIGATYRIKRDVPKENVVFINTTTKEQIAKKAYTSAIENPIREAIEKSKHRIDYIVLTKDIPIRIIEGGYSVDGHLAAMNLGIEPLKNPVTSEGLDRVRSPYFKSQEKFSSDKFNIYLVTRLTGYSRQDAVKLIDNSLAAESTKGLFFFDQAGNRNGGGYKTMQLEMEIGHKRLNEAGFESEIDKEAEFKDPGQTLMGYASWGSNDGRFNKGIYKNLKFHPGAIAETFVSTSARTFEPTDQGQSLIADLIASGVTGVKGYVSEPYTLALAKTSLLFHYYTSGQNLAESFYAASEFLLWKDMVVGDPLCRPFGD